MYYDDGTGALSYSVLYPLHIHLQRCSVRLHQHWPQPVIGHCQHRSDKRVGRHYHLVTLAHLSPFHIRTKDKRQRIQSVAASHAAPRTDEISVMPFKQPILSALQIPTAVHHPAYGLINLFQMKPRDIFQRQERNHSSNLLFSRISGTRRSRVYSHPHHTVPMPLPYTLPPTRNCPVVAISPALHTGPDTVCPG